ncbi:MAG TPA: S8 family serine peptidase, partial [Candidatus Paceibacterota bacterium]|nr:S8 family serine peptidase [Candidatus Paceibacterota bacterium]
MKPKTLHHLWHFLRPNNSHFGILPILAAGFSFMVLLSAELSAHGNRDFKLQAEVRPGGELILSWSELGPGYIYEVEWTDQLKGAWKTAPYAGEWPVTITRWSQVIDANAPARFYRVRAMNLIANPEDRTGLDFVPGEVVVILQPGASGNALATRHQLEVREEIPLAALGMTIARLGVPLGRLIENVMASLERDPAVKTVSQNSISRSQAPAPYDDPSWPEQHGFFQIRVGEAHARATGKGVRVAVIDSGLDLGHPEFMGRVKPEDCFDAVRGNHTFSDLNDGHGTHVAGIIAATGNNGQGIVGVAPDAELIIARSGGPSHTAVDIVECINFAVARGARVINMSLGKAMNTPDGDLASTLFEQVAINAAVQKGATVVVSAMNDQQQGSPYALPGLLPNIIAVGAVDSRGRVADFSNLRPYVDVVAPGVDILSAWPRHLDDQSGYLRAQGTSMAAPHVAGVAALMLEVNPDLTPCEVQAILEQMAQDLGTTGKDPRYGSGLVDAFAAVTAAGELRNNPDRLADCCGLAVLSETTKADVYRLRIKEDPPQVFAQALNTASVPWETATSLAADEAGNLYVTATGGFGPGIYRINRSGQIQPLAVGAPFETPAGITLDREGTILAVDRTTRRILRVRPSGDVTILHEGLPLVEPTGISYTEYRDLYVISDAAGSGDPSQGGIFSFALTRKIFQSLLDRAGDYEDVTSHIPSGNLFAATAPLGGGSGAEFAFSWAASFISMTSVDRVQRIPIDLGDFSTEGWTGICRDLAGHYWLADRDAPGGAIVNLFDAEDGIGGRSYVLRDISKPVDLAQIPPGTNVVAAPELIHLLSDHVFLSKIGDQATLNVQGKLSDNRIISLDEARQAGEIDYASLDTSVIEVNAGGKVMARGIGAAMITIGHLDLETTVLAFVGAAGLKIYHPATALSPAGFGDFAVPLGHPGIQLQIGWVFQDGSVLGIAERLSGSLISSENNLVALPGVGQVSGRLTFLAAGISRITAKNGPFSASIQVTVQGPNPISLTGIKSTEQAISLRVGQTHEIIIEKVFSNGEQGSPGNTLSGNEFSSANPAIATVGFLDGIVQGVSPGETTIRAQNGEHLDTVRISVVPDNQPPRGTIVSPAYDTTRYVGAAIPFRGEAQDADGTVIQAYWSFAGVIPNRAGLETGPVGFLKPGVYEVTFFVCDNEFATDPNPDHCRITILPKEVALTAVEITEGDLRLGVGEDRALIVLGHYSDGSTHNLTASMSQTRYASSDTSVARVSSDGVIHANKAGQATITATNNSIGDAIVVTVDPAIVKLVSIEIANAEVSFSRAGATAQLQVTGHYSDGSHRDLTAASTGTCYVSSRPEVAAVSADGLITALKNGTTTVMASHDGFTQSIRVAVDIPAGPSPTISVQVVKHT